EGQLALVQQLQPVTHPADRADAVVGLGGVGTGHRLRRARGRASIPKPWRPTRYASAMAGQSTTRREPPAPAKPRRRTRAAKAETQGDGAPAAKARARKASAKSSAPGRAAGAPARKSATAKRTGTTPAQEKSPRKAAAPARKPARPLSEAERASRFRMLLHTTCLKAGSAAAATAIATRVPLLNRVAPMLVGARLEA